MAEYGRLRPGNKLSYKIPFPIGMDTLLKFGPLTHDKVMDFIELILQISDPISKSKRSQCTEQVKQYLKLKQFSARTFEEYGLRGTPSAILIDKKGVLRQTTFGPNGFLEGAVKQLLNE